MKLCTECNHARWVDFMDNEERVHEPYRCMGIMVDPVTGAKREQGSLCRQVNTDGNCGQFKSRTKCTNRRNSTYEFADIKYLKDEVE